MAVGSSTVEVIDPANGQLVHRTDVFRVEFSRCTLAVADHSLWEACAGVRFDNNRVVGVAPGRYVVRIREPST
jgi:hypothetical protein